MSSREEQTHGANVRGPAFGSIGTRLEGGLTELQKSLARHLAMDVYARILQDQAPEPTSIQQYKDVFDLTQMGPFAEWQERMVSAPQGVIHPGHRVLAVLIQLDHTDIVLKATLGYLWNARKQISVAIENVKGLEYEIIRSMEGMVSQVSGLDKEGRGYLVHTSGLCPDSVILRRTRRSEGKAKREHATLKRKQARELDKRARGSRDED